MQNINDELPTSELNVSQSIKSRNGFSSQFDEGCNLTAMCFSVSVKAQEVEYHIKAGKQIFYYRVKTMCQTNTFDISLYSRNFFTQTDHMVITDVPFEEIPCILEYLEILLFSVNSAILLEEFRDRIIPYQTYLEW